MPAAGPPPGARAALVAPPAAKLAACQLPSAALPPGAVLASAEHAVAVRRRRACAPEQRAPLLHLLQPATRRPPTTSTTTSPCCFWMRTRWRASTPSSTWPHTSVSSACGCRRSTASRRCAIWWRAVLACQTPYPRPARPPACAAAKPRNPLLAGTPLQAIGLGDLYGNGTSATVLQQTQLVLQGLQTCNMAWPFADPDFFRNTAICASACVPPSSSWLWRQPAGPIAHLRFLTSACRPAPLQAPQSPTASPTSARATAVCGGAGAAARCGGAQRDDSARWQCALMLTVVPPSHPCRRPAVHPQERRPPLRHRHRPGLL